jgi:hypothetical protein
LPWSEPRESAGEVVACDCERGIEAEGEKEVSSGGIVE